jgi:hypothetical protein
MTKSTKQPTPDFRAHQHHLTALPVKDVLRIRLKDLGLKNTDLQKALGYTNPNVIAMMKTGSMRLPNNKVAITANLLGIDPVFLLGKVIAENDPELWASISGVMVDRLVSANEVALLAVLRQKLDGHDVNLAQSKDFLAAAEPALKLIAARETALAQAALQREDD